MVLFTKGLAQINLASSQADPSIDRYADIANLLKGAGGVFMALSQDFLPRWKETAENASTRHPETSEGVAMAMMDLITAQVSSLVPSFDRIHVCRYVLTQALLYACITRHK